MMKSVLLAFCVAALGLRVVAKSDFGKHCSDISLSGTVLTASCVNDHGTRIKNNINLNSCVENYGGNLKCHENGNYDATCHNCKLDRSVYLDCSCGDGKGGTPDVAYDLNKCIGSRDGYLTC